MADPTWSPLTLRCDCGHGWQDWQPLNVPIETWLAHMCGLACPACGAGRGTLRGKALATAVIRNEGAADG